MRKAERVGHGAEVLDHLGAHADVDHLVLVEPGEADLGLDERMLLALGREGVFDDEIGGGEAFLDVALADPVVRDDVVPALHQRRTRLCRLERIEDTGQ